MGKRAEHIPIRSCICCGAKRSKEELLRLVLDGRRTVVWDGPMTMPGRGAYVCKSETCQSGLHKARLDRAFRMGKARNRRNPVSSETKK